MTDFFKFVWGAFVVLLKGLYFVCECIFVLLALFVIIGAFICTGKTYDSLK